MDSGKKFLDLIKILVKFNNQGIILKLHRDLSMGETIMRHRNRYDSKRGEVVKFRNTASIGFILNLHHSSSSKTGTL